MKSLIISLGEDLLSSLSIAAPIRALPLALSLLPAPATWISEQDISWCHFSGSPGLSLVLWRVCVVALVRLYAYQSAFNVFNSLI